MKIVFAILLILLGSLLIGITVDSLGKTGNLIINIIGIGCGVGAVFIAGSKKEKQ